MNNPCCPYRILFALAWIGEIPKFLCDLSNLIQHPLLFLRFLFEVVHIKSLNPPIFVQNPLTPGHSFCKLGPKWQATLRALKAQMPCLAAFKSATARSVREGLVCFGLQEQPPKGNLTICSYWPTQPGRSNMTLFLLFSMSHST